MHVKRESVALDKIGGVIAGENLFVFVHKVVKSMR